MKKEKDKLSRSENMARVKSKNSSFELLLRKELWSRGLRYRTNDKTVFGKPDIVFKRKKNSRIYRQRILAWKGFYRKQKYT